MVPNYFEGLSGIQSPTHYLHHFHPKSILNHTFLGQSLNITTQSEPQPLMHLTIDHTSTFTYNSHSILFNGSSYLQKLLFFL